MGGQRWRVSLAAVPPNGNILADSGEGYSRRGGAREAIENIQSKADDTETSEV